MPFLCPDHCHIRAEHVAVVALVADAAIEAAVCLPDGQVGGNLEVYFFK
jgi:hypothetical protein